MKLRRAAVSSCAALGLLMLLVTFTPFVAWYAKRLAGEWHSPKGDTLIVLAGSDLNGFPGPNTLLRCLYAVRYYEANPYRKIVVTGSAVSAHMRNLLVAEGVPAQIIVLENSARSTRENALYTSSLLAGDNGRKVLLTSDFHMFRAVRTFRKAGLQVTPSPIPDVLKRNDQLYKRWETFLEESVETAKIVYYFGRGWI